ncbi:MAG: hypothetical protein HFJ30_04945 [Clostridia bacterium]|jgi:hypothetical protein|nr:hypothetical protein [Clostridia bacterium]MCI9412927.1 hypothetical protein [Clostridia bacterium]
MIEMITMILAIVLIAMVMLLAVLCMLYFKSKNKKPETAKTTSAVSSKKETKTSKSYQVESVFDFMEFDTVEDNMISTKNGGKYVMVVECQGINYDLMSEVEKNAVEEGFIQFLNTLRHPIQIYTQTRTINLESSIQTYRDKVKEIEEELEKEKKKYEDMVNSGRYTGEQLNAAFYDLTKATNLYEYGKDIIYTTEKMSLNKNVLNQKYYIIIPYYPEELGDNNFDKQEIRNLAFSELYTRAQSIVRTLSVCGVTGKVLDSNELVDLLYIAYNRDDAEIYGIDKAIEAGYNELYSTAPDVVDKKMKALNEQIEREAFEKANQKVIEAKTEKQKAFEQRQENQDDLIAQLASIIVEQNREAIGNDVADNAIGKIQEEKQKRRGRPKKQTSESTKEGGVSVNEQEGQTKRSRSTKTA